MMLTQEALSYLLFELEELLANLKSEGKRGKPHSRRFGHREKTLRPIYDKLKSYLT